MEWLKTIFLGIIVLILTIFVEVLAALWTIYLTKNKMLRAAVISAIIEMTSVFFLWVVLTDFLAITFGVIGAFLGTYYYKEADRLLKKLKIIK